MKKSLLLMVLLMYFSGCTTDTEIRPEVEPSIETFSDSSYGVSFEYPSTWLITSEDTEDILGVSISNQVSPEGYGCSEPFVGMDLTVMVRDSEKTFGEWFMSNYDAGGGLGSFGGAVEETTFSGYPAYHVEDFGTESYCTMSGYVVDYGKGIIVKIGIRANQESLDLSGLNEVIDSVKLSGYQGL